MKSLKCLTLFSLLALLTSLPPAGAQVIRNEDCLPPQNSAYAGHFHQQYPIGVLLSNPLHHHFAACDPPPGPGETTVHSFDSIVQANVTTPDGNTVFVWGQARVTVQVRFRNQAGPNRIFDTEMLQLDISGGTLPQGVMIRESPTLPSKGMTKITKLPDGRFKIDSFFDIFTELSVDGGQTWSAAQDPGHVRVTDTVLTKLALVPVKVRGGKNFKLKVALNTPAPVGGAVVTLTNTNSAANVPGSITVPEGEQTATIVVTTNSVTAVTVGQVSASYGGVTKTKTLTVFP